MWWGQGQAAQQAILSAGSDPANPPKQIMDWICFSCYKINTQSLLQNQKFSYFFVPGKAYDNNRFNPGMR